MSKEQQNDELVQMYRDLVEIFDEEYEKRRLITPQNTAEKMTAKGYRKQSENVIELPCKVGDTVYMPWEWNDTSGIAILTVERISITEAGQSIRTDLWSDDEDYWLAYNCGVFRFDDIGKVVFLTKEEAEQALAKMKGGAE